MEKHCNRANDYHYGISQIALYCKTEIVNIDQGILRDRQCTFNLTSTNLIAIDELRAKR